MIQRVLRSLLILGIVVLASHRTEAGLILTVNQAGSQTSLVSGVTTESFDSFAPGTYSSLTTAVGTLTSPGLAIVSANTVGGAGGSGNFFSVGVQSGQDVAGLTLNGPQSYFGFWWSAADPYNEVLLLSGGQVIGTFDTASTLGSLGSSYYGNPNGGDPGEMFVYCNIFATAGTTFDGVIFVDPTGYTGFETDNWSTLAAPVTNFSGVQINGAITSTASVPEPTSLALTGSGIVGLVAFAKRRRRS